MITKEDVIEFYSYFYRKRFNSVSYKFKPTEKSNKVIESFLQILEKNYRLQSVGRKFLWDYFVYSFNYWRDSKLVAFHGQFRIELIIGKKSFLRWKDNSKDDHWVIQKSEIINIYKFKRSDLISEEKLPEYIGDYEINIKKLKYNTAEGFYHCIEHTTLYNPNHKVCIFCDFKDDCKKLLKSKYPKVYDKRTTKTINKINS